jgi:hypothetical protein
VWDALQQFTIKEHFKGESRRMTEDNNEMLHQRSKLREAERVEIISLMDNSVDNLSTIQREDAKNVREWMRKHSILPIAERGFSMRTQKLARVKTSTLYLAAST